MCTSHYFNTGSKLPVKVTYGAYLLRRVGKAIEPKKYNLSPDRLDFVALKEFYIEP